MIRYPPQNRTACRCGHCARCASHLTDNYTDAECEAYCWLREQGIGGWAINNTTKLVNNTYSVIAFAKMKGMP